MRTASSPYSRVAITGMAMCNALGCQIDTIWQRTLAMHSGVRRLSPLADDPPGFFDPPFVPGVNSYCDVAALCDLNLSRHDLGLPPHDFAAMSASSRLTLYLARVTVAAAGLTDAGYDPQRVGVFVSQNAGESASTLWDLNVSLRAEWIARAAAQHGHWDAQTERAFSDALRRGRRAPDESSLLCRLNCTAAGIICRQFGFAGPSFSVGAACASSTAAIFVAMRLLRDGAIDAAVVGGGEEIYAPLYMAEFCALGALARSSEYATEPHQYSRPFDAHRNGFVLGEGAAMLVLEREETARKRHAPLHGLLTGAGHITNTLGLVEPSAEAQQHAIRMSFDGLDYGPAQVQLIECHATGTFQGDMEEGRALAHIYSNTGAILTAYKGQIGHTTGASGAMALIHGLLAMRDGVYPGTANCPQPDPAIALADAGLRIPSQAEEWPRPTAPGTDGIRRMQVNSFAFGGACFALQVEEPNDRIPQRVQGHGADRASEAAPAGALEAFDGQESVVDGVRLVSLTHQGQPWRLASMTPAWVQEIAGLPSEPSQEALHALARRGLYLRPAHTPPPVAFMCCGQGSVWPGMGRALYDAFAPARAAMDRIAAAASWDVLALMDETDIEKIIRTRWQQPYLFLLEFAQASYLQSLGFAPNVIAGHSLGELIALCLAGVYTPETAWHIIETRAQQMGKLEDAATQETGMMAVYGSGQVVESTLRDFPDLLVSNYNTPNQYILSGPRAALSEARRALRKNKVPAVLLNVSMAFHHPQMRIMREDSLRALHRIPLQVAGQLMQPAALPMLSCVTTQLYPTDNDAICRSIADLDESAVNWVDTVRALWNTHGVRHFVELGPVDTLCGLTCDIEQQAVCVPSARKDKEVEGMRAAVAQLYALGHVPHPKARAKTTTWESAPADAVPHTAAAAAVAQHVEDIFPIIMEATGYERHELGPEMDLRHDLAIRSSRFPMIIQAAERTFGISIRFEDLIGVATIRDLADALARLRQKNASAIQTSPAESAEYAPSLRRLLPCDEALMLPAPGVPGAFAQPLLLVGQGEGVELFAKYAAHSAATPAEALALLDALVQAPRTLVCVVSPQNTDPTQMLTEYLLVLQAFMRPKEARLCLAVTLQTESTACSILEGIMGMQCSAAFEYAACTFRAVTAHPAAPHTWVDCALNADAEAGVMPIPWRIHADGTATTPALRPALPDPAETAETAHAIGLRQGDVIVVSGGAGGITPLALEWLAPLGCTFALLGRSHSPLHPQRLVRLEERGAIVGYYACDITQKDSVESAFARIAARYGRIDGVLHAAGLTRDATLAALTKADIGEVIAVKCRGLDTLLRTATAYGLRYAVALSSLAGWLGNYGQSNYSAANRAMAAQLHAFCAAHALPSRCIWLPPVLGAGMADSADMREQLRQRGLEHACMDAEELAPMLARELCACAGLDVLWARHMPTVRTMRPVIEPPADVKRVRERPALYPLIFPLALDMGTQTAYTGGHHISHFAASCVGAITSNTARPVATAAHLLACLTENAAQALPWLLPVGIEKARLHEAIFCPQGVTRELRLHTVTDDWQSLRHGRGASDTLSFRALACATTARVRGMSANGRRTDIWAETASAHVLLCATAPRLMPLWREGTGMQRYILTQEEIAAMNNSRYAWPVRWIMLLLGAEALGGVEYCLCTGLCPHKGAVTVEIRHSTTAEGLPAQDAQCIHEDGTVLALLQGAWLPVAAP